MKTTTLILFTALVVLLLCSNSILAQQKKFVVGKGDAGICLGATQNFHGIRLNAFDPIYLLDFETIDLPNPSINGINIQLLSINRKVNGFDFGFVSFNKKLNGLHLAILQCNSGKTNGISFGGLFNNFDKANGIALSALAVTSRKKFNGLSISPIMLGEEMNGLIVAGLGFLPEVGRLRGVAVTGLMGRLELMKGFIFSPLTIIECQEGVSVGVINQAEDLHGIQFGLWNVARNKKHLKALPFINMSFRRKG